MSIELKSLVIDEVAKNLSKFFTIFVGCVPIKRIASTKAHNTDSIKFDKVNFFPTTVVAWRQHTAAGDFQEMFQLINARAELLFRLRNVLLFNVLVTVAVVFS